MFAAKQIEIDGCPETYILLLYAHKANKEIMAAVLAEANKMSQACSEHT